MIKVANQFRKYGVFSTDGPELVCIPTKDVAPDDIKNELLGAWRRGQMLIEDFVNLRLSVQPKVGFYDTIKKQKAKTFSALYNTQVVAHDGSQKAIKADRDQFRGLLIALKTGRNIDLNNLLQHELCPVTRSLAHMNGSF